MTRMYSATTAPMKATSGVLESPELLNRLKMRCSVKVFCRNAFYGPRLRLNLSIESEETARARARA
eukprot:scaffold4973_cov111-Skeletonema_marinoi.AAC.1